MDLFVLGNAVGCFGFYIISHLVLSRFSRAVSVISWLVKAFIVLGLLNAGLSLVFFMTASHGLLTGVLGTCVSFALYGVLCFSYVICCVGPYETSVRIRIIREMYEANKEMTIEQLRARYDNKDIFGLRLSRLLVSKDLVFDGNVYRNNRENSVFGGITAFSEFLKRCYGFKA